MTIELHSTSFISLSSLTPGLSCKQTRIYFSGKKGDDLDRILTNWGYSRKRCLTRPAYIGHNNRFVRNYLDSCKQRNLLHLASMDDGVTVNGSPQAGNSSDVGKMRVKLNQTLQWEDFNDGLVQTLHDSARVFELAIKEHSSFSKLSWFSTAWLGVDRNAFVKALSYQASVSSLLQAVTEISYQGNTGDRDVNVFAQRSLLHLSAPLESLIRDKLSAKQPETCEWLWSEQIPAVVTSIVNYFEGDSRFSAATAVSGRGTSSDAGNGSDVSFLMLALACIAAILNLGPAKVSCSQFVSSIPDVTGRLMEMLVDFIPVSQAYHSVKDVGLCKEFLVHFGPRAAACRVKNDGGAEEIIFWVGLSQKQLQRAIDRERIWSRLTTSESIEVLERDLAIFGFFIALGRSTQSFLSVNGFEVLLDDPLGDFIRYLIGGSVLYYPQLSSISSYQLYVEVVCEELEWLPFYPGHTGYTKQTHSHGSKREGPPNAEAIPQALEVCSHWIQCFIKYSKWLENPSNVKAAKFLSIGHKKLAECKEELGFSKNQTIDRKTGVNVGSTGSINSLYTKSDLDSIDKALESVEEALVKLEQLLQELHFSNSNCGKEQLKAACSDLEKIRKLKKETEFLEASFRAKAAFLQQSSVTEQSEYRKGKNEKSTDVVLRRSNRLPGRSRGLWSSWMRTPKWKSEPEQRVDASATESTVDPTADTGFTDSKSNEIQRFELLRKELMKLEERAQRSADQSDIEEDTNDTNEDANDIDDAGSAELAPIQKKENVIEKSIDKLKEASTDVWQGTQLLAIDLGASTGLLRRALIGDELTEKEKKVLKRTLTDLASVVPIGILMLLPVTAVGHAAMLAAIQRYIPSLIPSTYRQERLNLLRQLEKVKETKTIEDGNLDKENTQEELT